MKKEQKKEYESKETRMIKWVLFKSHIITFGILLEPNSCKPLVLLLLTLIAGDEGLDINFWCLGNVSANL